MDAHATRNALFMGAIVLLLVLAATLAYKVTQFASNFNRHQAEAIERAANEK
jgi:hypothetical protein